MNDNIDTSPKNGYYYNLKKYKPMCYSGKGIPFFLLHEEFSAALPCLAFIDVIFILVIIFTFLTAKGTPDEEFKLKLINMYILVLILITFTGLLTVFMNPGIVSQEDMEEEGSRGRFCQRCNRKAVDMTHCRDCQVCVQDLDHHCGFFGKCIAGRQRFAFYGFIFFVFCGFVLLLVGVSLNVS